MPTIPSSLIWQFSSCFSISFTFSSPSAPLVTKALSANIRRNAYRNQSLICQRMKLTQSHPHNRSPQLYKPVKARMPKWLVLHCWNRAIRLANKFIRNKNLWKTLTNFINIDDLRTSKLSIAESWRIATQVTLFQHVIRTIIWATKKERTPGVVGSTTKWVLPKRLPEIIQKDALMIRITLLK